jgi:hypothetical protein
MLPSGVVPAGVTSRSSPAVLPSRYTLCFSNLQSSANAEMLEIEKLLPCGAICPLTPPPRAVSWAQFKGHSDPLFDTLALLVLRLWLILRCSTVRVAQQRLLLWLLSQIHPFGLGSLPFVLRRARLMLFLSICAASFTTTPDACLLDNMVLLTCFIPISGFIDGAVKATHRGKLKGYGALPDTKKVDGYLDYPGVHEQFTSVCIRFELGHLYAPN